MFTWLKSVKKLWSTYLTWYGLGLEWAPQITAAYSAGTQMSLSLNLLSITLCTESHSICVWPLSRYFCVTVFCFSVANLRRALHDYTWLLLGSRVCHVAFVWTAMIPLIIYFINAFPIPLALLTIATTVTCAPEPITAHRSHVRTRANHCRAQTHDNKQIYTCSGASWTGILPAVRSRSVLCI